MPGAGETKRSHSPSNRHDDSLIIRMLTIIILKKILQELIETLQEPCRAAAEAMLCHYAFPDCSIQAGEAAGLPLCYEDCVAIK